MKMWQPLVYSSVSGVIDLWYNPLIQIYLLGRAAEGPYARPFGAVGPVASGLPGGAAPGAGGGAPGGGLAALLNASKALSSAPLWRK